MNNRPGRLAFKVASFYVIVAAIWIYGSEEVVRRFVHDPDIRLKFFIFKGWGFVLVTGLLLYQFLYRLLVRWDQAKSAQQAGEARYRKLFANMNEGVAYCRMIFQDGQPVDFVYLAVNSRFTGQTGLKDVIGKRVSEVIPGIRESDPGAWRGPASRKSSSAMCSPSRCGSISRCSARSRGISWRCSTW
jgi:PAS domain-containing protein